MSRWSLGEAGTRTDWAGAADADAQRSAPSVIPWPILERTLRAVALLIGALGYLLAAFLAVSYHSMPRLDVFAAPAMLVLGCLIAIGTSLSYPLKAFVLLCVLLIANLILNISTRLTQMQLGYVLGVLAGGMLLGPWGATGMAVVTSLAILGQSLWLGSPLVIGHLVILWLTLALLWASLGGLHRALVGAEAGAQAAWQQLHEARVRRGQLYSVVRSLEEATFRIERINSELNQARLEAELARAERTRFVAMVSHEIRGPLNLILGFSRLMVLSPERYGKPLPPAYRADMDAVYRNAEHLAALIDDVIDLAQIEAERLPLVKDQIDLGREVLADAVEIVRPLAERKGLSLLLDIAADLPQVLADPVRLRQVLLNLLTNAVRHTRAGEIEVTARLDGEEVLVRVRDTGEGIPPEDIPRLFREFSQVGAGAKGQKGSGLGLSISKHLIDMHGGRIWVESKEGVGTTISFTLPLPGAQPNIRLSQRKFPAGRAGAPQTLLMVHPDAALVRLLGRHIVGYRVVGVGEITEAETLLEELHPQGIITTPHICDTLQKRLAEMQLDVPIITCELDGGNSPQYVQDLLTYLVKPVTPETLFAVMQRVNRDEEMCVLLVDDDIDSVRLLETLLLALPHPYRVLKAYSGLQALEIVQKHTPDVIFIDLLMPQMSGQETIARLRADERLRDVPIVVVSAMDVSEGIVRLRTPITLSCNNSIDVTRGVKCLQAMIDALATRHQSA